MTETSTRAADEAAASLLGSLHHANPYPAYARLRSLAPVYVPAQGPVVLTSYRAVSAMLHDPRAGKDSAARFQGLGMPDWRDHPGLRMMYDSILQLDGPDHGRLRSLVSKVFTARRTENLRASVRAIVARLTRCVARAGKRAVGPDRAMGLPTTGGRHRRSSRRSGARPSPVLGLGPRSCPVARARAWDPTNLRAATRRLCSSPTISVTSSVSGVVRRLTT